MYLLIRYADAAVLEAVVLTAAEASMRIAAPGVGDVIELTEIGAQWFTDSGERVELEFMGFDESAEWSHADGGRGDSRPIQHVDDEHTAAVRFGIVAIAAACQNTRYYPGVAR